jgi:hypothetical protein
MAIQKKIVEELSSRSKEAMHFDDGASIRPPVFAEDLLRAGGQFARIGPLRSLCGERLLVSGRIDRG